LYWNDEELVVEPYHKKQKQYYCGKELLRFSGNRSKVYTICIVDLTECVLADVYSDAEIVKRIDISANIDRPHKTGGQSAQRFARIRENQITQYFKRINEHMKKVDGEIYLGISFVYKKRFLNKLNTYNLNKIKRINKTEYGGMTGIYQFINKLEIEKGNVES